MSDVTSSILKNCWLHLSFNQCSLVGIDGNIVCPLASGWRRLSATFKICSWKENDSSSKFGNQPHNCLIEPPKNCPWKWNVRPIFLSSSTFCKVVTTNKVVAQSWWISDKHEEKIRIQNSLWSLKQLMHNFSFKKLPNYTSQILVKLWYRIY